MSAQRCSTRQLRSSSFASPRIRSFVASISSAPIALPVRETKNLPRAREVGRRAAGWPAFARLAGYRVVEPSFNHEPIVTDPTGLSQVVVTAVQGQLEEVTGAVRRGMM